MRKKVLFSLVFLFVFLFLARGYWLPTDIRLDTGDLPGAGGSLYPKIACSGDNVYAVWEDRRNGWRDLYFNYSSDGGWNWQMSDIRLDTGDSPGAHESHDIQIACSGRNVYIVWIDARNGRRDIYFNYSKDGGATWQTPDIRLDTGDPPGGGYSWYPKIACSGERVYVVWHDWRTDPDADIYFNYSNDGGMTWQIPDIRLDTGDSPGANGSYNPDIACLGDRVYVVWMDDRNGDFKYDIYFKCSYDGGLSWLTQEIRINTGDTPGTSESWSPKIACSGDNIYVLWDDERNGNYKFDIYFNSSTDGGLSWQTSDIRLDTGDLPGAHDSAVPQIACSGDNVYAVWDDHRNGLNPDIYFNYSADGGLNWQSSDIRLDTGDAPGASESWGPQIACYGESVYAVWFDGRYGGYQFDIFLDYSLDAGKTWRRSDIRLDTGDPPGANYSAFPQIASSENGIYAVWHDYRDGTYDIYFNFNIFYRNVLTIAAGQGGTTRPKPGTHACDAGERVKIEAIPDEGYFFSHWSGDVEGTDNPIKIKMDSDKSVKANFTKQYTLRVKTGKGGATDPAPGIYAFDPGTEVSIRAIPASGYRFGEWSGDISSTDNPLKITMNSKVLIKANFIRQCALTLACGAGGTSEPAPGAHLYDAGTKVAITAIPDTRCQFSRWSGGISGTANPKIITLNKDKSIMANFIRIIYSPLNFTGQKEMNSSLLQVEYINALAWQANPNNVNIVKYRIYQVEGETASFLVELNADTSKYWHRGVEKEKRYTYALVAVNDEGREGGRAYITVS